MDVLIYTKRIWLYHYIVGYLHCGVLGKLVQGSIKASTLWYPTHTHKSAGVQLKMVMSSKCIPNKRQTEEHMWLTKSNLESAEPKFL